MFRSKRGLPAAALLSLFSLILPGRAQGSDGYIVVVHRTNPTESMTAERVSALFLKKVTKWDNGATILPVDLVVESSVRERFSKAIHGKSVSAVKAYWQQMIFSGRDVPPPEKASEREVVAFVEANPGAVGYVSADASVGGCRVLEVR